MSDFDLLSVAVLGGLESAINAALALDPATRERLSELEGRVIAIELKGTGHTLYLLPANDGLRLMAHFDGSVDTTLRGAPFALFRMNSGKPGEGLFSGDVTIDGDVELGQRIQRIFQQLDIDWEEHLSRLTGDIIAHQVGNGVRNLFAWGKQAADTLGMDTSEYLQYEREILPTRHELEAFLGDVDELRISCDRLDARLRRLTDRAAEVLDNNNHGEQKP